MTAYYPVQIWTGNDYTGLSVKLQYTLPGYGSLTSIGLPVAAHISSIKIDAYTEVQLCEFGNFGGRRHNITGPINIPNLTAHIVAGYFKTASIIVRRIPPTPLDKMNCCLGNTPPESCGEYVDGVWQCNNSVADYCKEDAQSLQICKDRKCMLNPESPECIILVDDPNTSKLSLFINNNTNWLYIVMFIWFVLLIITGYMFVIKPMGLKANQ